MVRTGPQPPLTATVRKISKPKLVTPTKQTAGGLRRKAMETPAGELIGSEDEVISEA